jgi:hypothetical protein
MARTITVNVPHKLSQAEVRSRIVKGIADAQSQFGAKVAKVEHTWAENHLDFKVAVMGQTVSGDLDINPQDVAIRITLPWMLAAFADKIRPQIQQQGQKLLS